MNGKGDRNRSCSEEYRKKFEETFGTRCRIPHKHTSECPGYEHLKGEENGEDNNGRN